jgi:hypothetical protein
MSDKTCTGFFDTKTSTKRIAEASSHITFEQAIADPVPT